MPTMVALSGMSSDHQHSPVKVALTGGIASGKSTICGVLKAENVPTIDADDIVHDLLANDTELKKEILTAFGRSVFLELDIDKIDRKALGGLVFDAPDKRRHLESLIHPKVRQRVAAFFEANADAPFGVAIIPLLFESQLAAHYDVIWLVQATEDQQIERLKTCRNLSEAEARARIASQLSFTEKHRRLLAFQKDHAQSDLPVISVIDNTGTIEEARLQTQRCISALKQAIVSAPRYSK